MTDAKYVFFVLIIVAVVLEVVGDVLLKKWTIESRNTLLAAGLLIYFIGSVFWIVSLKYEFLSKAISIFTVLNMVLLVLAGMLLFKEDLTLVNKLGISLGILSIILIEV